MFDDIYDNISSNNKNVSDSDFKDDTEEKVMALLIILLKDYNFPDAIDETFTSILKKYAIEITNEAIKEIKDLGGTVTKKAAESAVDKVIESRIKFLKDELQASTKDKISTALKDIDNADQINIAVKNIYGLSKERADFIANVEFKNLTNSARVAIAKESDKVAGVLVSDGTEFDSPCINANGQIWSLEYAGIS